MTLSEYRSNPHWKAAIDLGPAVARMADELPIAEANGLSQTLRALMVEVPAAIAGDLVSGTTTRQAAILKLIAALELVEKVYPALDTADARTGADALAAGLFGPGFAASAAPQVAPANPALAKPAPVTVDVSGEVQPSGTSQPQTPAAQIPVLAQPTAGPQEDHVQSDSVQ